jgi:DNA-binding transcriptional LysR family regulator
MDTEDLRTFLTVAEELHFGRAAERLHVAQPYLSRKIRSLEEDLGAPLFQRTTRRVELTPAGATLIGHARAIVASESETRASVTAAHEGRSGRVRIAFAGPSAHVAVGQLARAVREEHPLIDLELLPGHYGSTAVTALLRNEADLALARFAEPPPGVNSRRVDHDRFVIAVPSSHRLAGKDTIAVSDLRDEPLVAFPESHGSVVRAILVAQCQAAGFVPRFVQTSPDSWTCVALVAAGVGLHFTTTQAVAYLPLEGVRIREITDPLPTISVFLVWREGPAEHSALHRVLATSEQVLATAHLPA